MQLSTQAVFTILQFTCLAVANPSPTPVAGPTPAADPVLAPRGSAVCPGPKPPMNYPPPPPGLRKPVCRGSSVQVAQCKLDYLKAKGCNITGEMDAL